MKLQTTFLALCAALFVLVCASGLAYAEQSTADPERWDLRIIEEEPIWRYLLVQYGSGPAEKYWPERKAALQTVIREYPDSQWADDAAVMLACGQATMEGDIPGGIAALRAVMEKYPLEHTIVEYWDWHTSGSGCIIAPDWLYVVPAHVSRRNPSFPSELVAYFEHLEKYPRLTKDIAQYLIAYMLSYQGNKVGAIAELEDLISRYPDLAAINAADREEAAREMAAGPDGWFIIQDPGWEKLPLWRPQYRAYISLMGWYGDQGDQDKALATGLKLVSFCSPDGWDWCVNKQVAALCAEMEFWTEAEKQFQLALQGVHNFVAVKAQRLEELGYKPPGFVSWEDEALKGWKYNISDLERRLQEVRSFWTPPQWMTKADLRRLFNRPSV